MAGVSHPALGCSSRESSRSIDILHGENVRECAEEEWHEEYKRYKTKEELTDTLYCRDHVLYH